MKTKVLTLLLAVSLTGCHGILDSIYDDAMPDDAFAEGFLSSTASQWVLQLDARSYDEWIYIDLHERTLQRIPIPRTLTGDWDGRSGVTYNLVEGDRYTRLSETQTDAQPEPENWDLAIHHFDVKTNHGEVARKADGIFVPDMWTDNQVIVDLREMMGYRIGYQNSMVNRVLTTWVTMDFSTPPPTYTASGDTYLLRMSDGTVAEIRLLSYISERGTKGYLTIEFTFPTPTPPTGEVRI